ncbi:hypothetical protein [Marinobacterium sediminicola]|uniref:Insulinase (Peptidase family M16) n=1 Tax=Marinobacterium sediminicola TaxID=518898 RepID=A0ABY1RZA9_9GAMM|nr:hypothetical protein [Marinobacterium sediminicola]ULG69158.1 hypothetical protein LN244_15995 [Marinobacterium sediminicola]SMR73560.1 hypothetical protein SAMN04487964_10536 [Marinobacterium sediminicola]
MTRPLLSRRHLSLLILFLPGIILLLSRLGSDPEPSAWQANPDLRVYQQTAPAQSTYRLHLLLPQPLDISSGHQLEQQLLLHALQQRLGNKNVQTHWQQRLGALPTFQRQPGHVLLALNLDQAPVSAELSWLLQELQVPPSVDWPALLKRAQAEHYLARQEPEAWLKSQFPDQEPDGYRLNPLTAYQAWLQPGRWQLTLSSPEPLSLELPTDHPPTPIASTQELLLKALPVAAPATPTGLHLHRWSLPAVGSVELFALNLLARESIQQQLSMWLEQHQNNGIQAGYSLSWIPALPHGRTTLILQGDSWPALKGWLPQQLASVDLEPAREAVMEQIRHPERQQFWVDLLAIHQLPADTLTRLPKALMTITPDELQLWLQARLESDYYHTLSLPASP